MRVCLSLQTQPFRADAILANPPAYGHTHCAEALNVPLHILFTMPWTPTKVKKCSCTPHARLHSLHACNSVHRRARLYTCRARAPCGFACPLHAVHALHAPTMGIYTDMQRDSVRSSVRSCLSKRCSVLRSVCRPSHSPSRVSKPTSKRARTLKQERCETVWQHSSVAPCALCAMCLV